MANIIITTTNRIPNREISNILGVVRGSTVRTRNIGRDIGATLKGIVGGEIKTYTEMTVAARDEAYKRMVDEAVAMGADAVVGVRFATSMIVDGTSEMLAYGTAVKL